jgi:hypothetical protein
MPDLNEKTLELNITHEILGFAHRFDPHAFAFGTTMMQEHQGGYDSRVLSSLPGFWQAAVLQYKRAFEMRQDIQGNRAFWFRINNNRHNDQHRILYHLAAGRPNIAMYVFPALVTLRELEQHVHRLLNRTYLADATDIPPAFVGSTSHDVEVVPHRLMATVHSKRHDVKVRIFENLAPLLDGRQIGLPMEVLLSNARREPPKGTGTRRARFHFMVLPGQ